MSSHEFTWSRDLMNLQRESSASASRASASLSSKLAGQNHGDANPDTINTVLVLPSDPRIEYDSSTSWVDTTQSGIGSCTNGTRVAKVAGSSFTFAFSGTYFHATCTNRMNHLSVQGRLWAFKRQQTPVPSTIQLLSMGNQLWPRTEPKRSTNATSSHLSSKQGSPMPHTLSR